MSRSIKSLVAIALAIAATASLAQGYPNIGRAATEKEVAAWDIDVRPDFKGLPKGSGTVAKGMQVWEGKCAQCHGTFGESNEVFTPIVGGTTKEDIKTGRVAALADNKQPQRTTMMKVATVSTLWDYINRAMPWTAPKTLTTEEVYSVTAYILNMAEVLPDEFTLSDKNIAEVQKLMPNRNGMTQNHGMWDVKGKPDVKSVACMKDCPVGEHPRSTLPEAARNVHGNVAEQNRSFGAVRGADTSKPAPTAPISAAKRQEVAVAPAAAPATRQGDPLGLAKQYACVACHGVSNKIVGPGFNEIAAKYKSDKSADATLFTKVKNGSSGAWGPVPMPAQAHVKDEDIKMLVNWILAGAK
ncbi:cytochrome C [Noviherbaspirillum cavernae]|uniref:Cytochrome C n=1 Tax=Noviherbaspirillum cavernae TaxID=2320862 RepID=A0A418WZM3_9BURK|nr:c-type cytochrome [Noviherbaspirillum cavernae]RJG05688.1 cytochrome C [Noviherbaspirillum cavernae]